LPAAENLSETSYTLIAHAYDRAGNDLSGVQSNFVVDKTLPASVSVTTPSQGSSMQSLSSLGGSASDNSNGSGVARVEAFLRYRNSSGVDQYWALRNGSWGWGSDILGITAALTAPGATTTGWTISNGSPSGTQLPSGANLGVRTYTCVAYVYDRAGNRTRSATPDVSFRITAGTTSTVSRPVSEGQKSTVVLSSSSATTGGSITLAFTGALNAAKAVEAARYSVQQNGAELEVESVSLANSTTVVLGLPSGALRVGDRLKVGYDLQDSKNLTLQGEADITVK
jgi:hypothetical protein